METTITQSGALFAAHHKTLQTTASKTRASNGGRLQYVVPTLRTSVGKFALRPTKFGIHLEIMVGQVSRVLGLYKTNEEAVHALKDRRTGFTPGMRSHREAPPTRFRE